MAEPIKNYYMDELAFERTIGIIVTSIIPLTILTWASYCKGPKPGCIPITHEKSGARKLSFCVAPKLWLLLAKTLLAFTFVDASSMQSIQRKRWRSAGGSARWRSCYYSVRAFSIFELVIVCLIMSILGAVAAPTFFDSLLFHRVESAARRVKADLELARTQARLTSASQSVAFTNATSTYTIATIKSLDKPNQAYSVDLTKAPFSLTSATANFGGNASVTFDGYGTPSSGGTVTLAAKSHQCIVTLNATTGDVTITSNHSGGRTAAVPGS